MLLLPIWRTRSEQPQDGARLDENHPIGSLFEAAFIPAVSAANLAVRGRDSIISSGAAAEIALPKGMRTRRLSASNTTYSCTPAFRASAYPFTLVWAGQITGAAGSSSIISLSQASMPGGTYHILGGGSSTQVAYTVRNNFGTALSFLANVPGGAALGVELVIVMRTMSATDHRLCVNGAIFTSSTNIGSLVTTYDRLLVGNSSTANQVDTTFLGFWSGTAITDAQAIEMSLDIDNIWAMFQPQKFWLPMSSGVAPRTEVTSLGSAIQLASQATAGVAAAIQDRKVQTTSMDGVVSAALSAQAILAAAVQAQQSATETLSAAVLASGSASASANLAVQAANLAASAASAAVSAQASQTTSLSTMVQADHSLTVGTSAMVQTGSSLAVSVAAAVQAQAQAAASLAGAVQSRVEAPVGLTGALQVVASSSATLAAVLQTLQQASSSLSAQVQDGSTSALSLDVAIRAAQAAAVSVRAAVQVAGQATTSLSAAASLRQFLTLGVSGGVRAGRLAGTGLSVNIFDPDAGAPPPPFSVRVVSSAARRVVVGSARRIVRA